MVVVTSREFELFAARLGWRRYRSRRPLKSKAGCDMSGDFVNSDNTVTLIQDRLADVGVELSLTGEGNESDDAGP